MEATLIKWLAKAVQQEQLKLEDLKSPKLLFNLIKNIPGFNLPQFVEDNENHKQWQTNYLNYKNIFNSIENYYRSKLKSSFPLGLPSVNLLQISKGQDKEGLMGILIIFFIACINSDIKDKYIPIIMELDDNQQLDIMQLIQQKGLISLEIGAEDTKEQKQKVQENRLDELYFKMQSLGAENESLNLQLMAQAEEKLKLKQQIKKLEQQNKKAKRQLDEKTLYIQQKQQQQMQEESSNRLMSDSNQQIIKQLKKELLEQQRKHLQQRGQLKEEIQTIKQRFIVAQDKIAELQSEDLVGMNTNRRVQHQDCVSINEHKNITQKLQMRLKDLQQKETVLQRELARAKYEYEELQRKLKKQEKDKQNLKMEYEKISNNKSQMISQKDAQSLKLSVLTALRDKMKLKLADYGKKEEKI